jgi:hypothetical protein
MSSNNDIIQVIMNDLNAHPQRGRIHVMDPLADEMGLDSVLPGDVVIAPDFDDDELCAAGDTDGVNELAEWYNGTLYIQIDRVMNSLGYEMIHENDGSGGGLYYGIVQYRKRFLTDTTTRLRIVK